MKRQFLAFVMTILLSLGVNAQDYNKWSIDASGGVSVLSSSGFSEGYFASVPNVWTTNGVFVTCSIIKFWSSFRWRI